MRHRCSFQGVGSFAFVWAFPDRTIRSQTDKASGPETRIIAMPPFPGGVDSA